MRKSQVENPKHGLRGDMMQFSAGPVSWKEVDDGLSKYGLEIVLHTFFFIRILFIRITRLRFSEIFYRKWRRIHLLKHKTSPNETVYRETHFKHIIGGRGRWEIREKW